MLRISKLLQLQELFVKTLRKNFRGNINFPENFRAKQRFLRKFCKTKSRNKCTNFRLFLLFSKMIKGIFVSPPYSKSRLHSNKSNNLNKNIYLKDILFFRDSDTGSLNEGNSGRTEVKCILVFIFIKIEILLLFTQETLKRRMSRRMSSLLETKKSADQRRHSENILANLRISQAP
jgi:hypothetical protein